MKMLIILLSLGVLSSCSSTQEKKKLTDKIHSEEVRSLHEIKSHAQLLLEGHPELDETTKNELSALLDATMNRHQALKDEESQIFQLLLSKSLRVRRLTDSEVKDKNSLKLRLKDVYDAKSRNILVLIDRIVILSEQNVINDGFRHDMIEFMRDFR